MLVRVIKSGSKVDLSVEYAVLKTVRRDQSEGEVVYLDYYVPGKYKPSLFTPDLFLVPHWGQADNLFIHGEMRQRVFVFGGSQSSVVHTGYLMPGNSDVFFSKEVFDEKQTFGQDCFAVSKQENGKFFVWKWEIMQGCPKGSVLAMDKAKEFKIASPQKQLSEGSVIFFWMFSEYIERGLFFLRANTGYWFHALACIGLEFCEPEFQNDSSEFPFVKNMKFPKVFNRVFSMSEITEFCKEFIQVLTATQDSESVLTAGFKFSLENENLIIEFPKGSNRTLSFNLLSEESRGALPEGFYKKLQGLVPKRE